MTLIAYTKVAKPIVLDQIPLISNDKCFTQMQPENPGGMIISNQNKMIYDPIKSDKQNKKSITELNFNINTEEDKLHLLQQGYIESLQKKNDKNFISQETTEPSIKEENINDIFAFVRKSENISESDNINNIEIGTFQNIQQAKNKLSQLQKLFSNKISDPNFKINTIKQTNKTSFNIKISGNIPNKVYNNICQYAKKSNLKCNVMKS